MSYVFSELEFNLLLMLSFFGGMCVYFVISFFLRWAFNIRKTRYNYMMNLKHDELKKYIELLEKMQDVTD